jgi:hypothetical protein
MGNSRRTGTEKKPRSEYEGMLTATQRSGRKLGDG